VHLIPDPCSFDIHLRDEMLAMADARSVGMIFDARSEPRIERLMKQDFQRNLISLPREALKSELLKGPPIPDGLSIEDVLQYVEQLKEDDPLVVLQEDSLTGGEKGGQFQVMKLTPNFEMAMYLAQATGACIITDSAFRWNEIDRAIRLRANEPHAGLAALARNVENSEFLFPQNVMDIATFALDETFAGYPPLFSDIYKYLSNLSDRGPKPNREANLGSRFAKVHEPAQNATRKANIPAKSAKISCVFPLGGIQDNTVNRLLLMSSSERQLPSVPMAFFLEERSAS
jgi:hypothetical protein